MYVFSRLLERNTHQQRCNLTFQYYNVVITLQMYGVCLMVAECGEPVLEES